MVLAVTLFGCSPISIITTNWEKVVNTSEVKTAQTSQTENLAQKLPITAKTKISQEVIDLEVAQTSRQQALGLMFREFLPDNRGMLFPFAEPQIARFWMKNVDISLDIIFLYKGEVKAIAANVPPCSNDPCPTYGSDSLIDQVLELRGGRAKELNLKTGDRLLIEFLNINQ